VKRFVAFPLCIVAAAWIASGLHGCSNALGPSRYSDAGSGATGEAGAEFTAGEELRIPVPDGQRVYVKLASPPAIVTPAAPTTDKVWDLAFEGLEVYTNSGPSGSGGASAFGPLDPIVFLADVAPETPFLSADRTGGAFLRWYAYDGGASHTLYSRYHVFGVKDGDTIYRVQILTYYGQRDGTLVSALYKIRYGVVGQPGKEATDLDATAGGTKALPDAPIECIDLGTDKRMMLTPAAARTSRDWHLCFRREAIFVNGESGGPRNVGAIDLDAASTATEQVSDVAKKTAESEAARFDAVNAASFANQTFRGDRIVSAFTGLWLDRAATPPAPADSAWRVIGADGKTNYLVGFARFEGATATSPGTIVMRSKVVK
jgi:hypothetical protein